ncbi:MAG: insulinase family protein [Verrucomicrobia bacterium]|nr:insulinase family protein [Verrucomicrobiota bacterium]
MNLVPPRFSPDETAAIEIPARPPGVRIVTLDSGLTIILREDHSAPVVSAQAWCRTGSIDEGAWLGAGLSHVLEHMLFKGTTTRGAGRIDQEVQTAGGYMNAYTSFDRTVYWINVPNTGARVAIDILCDIMQNASLPAAELAKELDVIRREMDMGQDDPARRSGRRLFEVAYTKSPYRHTIIGYLDIFNQLKPDDISGYYRARYAPNNLFFVVVGDMDAATVEAQIRSAFAQSKARPLPPAVLPEEPRQTAPREVIEEAPIELGHLHISWHIPELRHPDVPILDVLAVLLGNGRSSRLFQEVREKRGLVHSVDAWTYNPGNPGLFGMSAVVDGEKFPAARTALLAEIERMKDGLVPAVELGKAVKQFTAATLATRKTMQGQAQDLGGNWLAATDLNFSERYLAAVKRIQPEDLQRVAREYLRAESRTLYALLPAGCAPKLDVVIETSTSHVIQKFEFANGLRLLVKEDHRLPFVQLRAMFKGGVLAETAADNGLTQLMAKLLLKGTATRTAEQIATEIESLGGSIDSHGGNNSFGVHAEVMREDFATGLDLLADVLLRPALPPAELERERELQLAGIRAQKDQLLQSAGRAMRRALFGDTGYGLNANGSEESVAALKRNQLQAFQHGFTVPNNCVLAIYGDVQTGEVRNEIERVFSNWKPDPKLPERFILAPVNPPVPRQRRVVEPRDKQQAVLVIGFPGTTLFDEDRFALELIQEACSDLGSRLFLRIRDELGLAYYVGAQNFPGLIPGCFSFYCGTAPETVAQVEAEIFQQAAQLAAAGLTAEELSRAKAKILGQKKIERQDLGNLSLTTALDELYGLGYVNSESDDAHYESVTLDQIKAVAQKYLQPDAAVVAVVQPPSKN